MKNRRAIWLLAVLLVVARPAAVQQKDTPEVLLKAAIQRELVDGDLPGAIEAYKKIVARPGVSRGVAAKALLQMGRCYEKLGKAEARKTYEQILRDYADQRELAATARARLAALSGNGASRNSEMVTRRVWAGPDVDVGGSLSPDGRYLSCVDGATGDVALRDLVTGKMRRLTHEGSQGGPRFSLISPDGKEVAYSWFNKDQVPELRVVGLDGSAPRILYSNKEVFPAPADWSPDGKYILTTLYKPGSWLQIALVSVADGSVRTLKTPKGAWPEKMKFSPDGRYIAYDFPQQPDSSNWDIFLLAADGSREIRVVEHPADDQLLGWTPDGNHILFASDRSGSMSMWVIRLADGKPQGSPELVKQDTGQAFAIGFTRAGSFYYGLLISASDVYTAEFDPAAGRVLTQPQKATQRFVGSNGAPAWSPDGQYLAYLSDRRPGFLGFLRHLPAVISIRSLKTGEERDLSPKLSFVWGPMRWSPDGRAILVPGKDSKGLHGVFQIDAQTGEVTPLVQQEPGSHVAFDYPAFLPDGKRLLYISNDYEGTHETILMRDLETGRDAELFRAARPSKLDDIALSPDGRLLALTLLDQEARSSVLKVLPVAGGDASDFVRAKEPEAVIGDSLSWSSDSRYIVFGMRRAAGQERETQVLAIPSAGGEPHALGLTMNSVRRVSFHPDGRRVAFAAGQLPSVKTEVWVMENFLPTLKAAK